MKLLKKGNVLYIVFLSIAFIYFGSVSRVDATPILEINGTTEAVDQGAGDTNPVLDHVSLSSYPGFPIFSVGGSTGPDPANSPDLNISGTIMDSVLGGGMLEIAINETGYSATDIQGFDINMSVSNLNLINPASVTFEYYIGVDDGTVHNDNANWSTHDLISSFDFTTLSQGDTYALTIVAIINTVPSFSPSFFNFGADVEAIPLPADTAVPEPATVLLIGIGLAGLCGGCYFRRRRANKTEKG